MKLQIITFRGFLLTILLLFYLTGPVRLNSDIIATVISCVILILLIFIVLITLVDTFYLKRNLHIKIASLLGGSEAQENSNELPYKNSKGNSVLYAGQDNSFLFKFLGIRIKPFFFLNFSCRFENSIFESQRVSIMNPYLRDEDAIFTMRFPHRGLWKIDRCSVLYGDIFGLTRVSWEQKLATPSTFEVYPPEEVSKEFPVISSSSVSGDLCQDFMTRKGDPFDMKQYHPSDGMKKILWKIYARSGELVARQEEASMVPEGRTVLFIAADQEDDALCSYSLHYIRKIIEYNIDILVGCKGMAAPPVHNLESSYTLLIHSVWTTKNGNDYSDFKKFIDGVLSMHTESSVNSIVLFASPKESNRQYLQNIASYSQSVGISPIFFLETKETIQKQYEGSVGVYKLFERWFFEDKVPQNNKASPEKRSHSYSDFLSLCAKNNWEVN